MSTLRSFLLESHIPEHFTRAVYAVLPLVEATNINKQYLVQQAGSPEGFKEARERVQAAWDSAQMGNIVKGNLLQKLVNFLCLMEIRKPGFTTGERLAAIHDLAVHNSLEQRFVSKVNSDTDPEDAARLLGDAAARAERAASAYPDLTPEEEKVWNRVKVYHEFPDGFRWVYAVDASGKVCGHIPSRITSKTMHHCGNEPSDRPGNEYWELRDANNKAYLTVILDDDGRIEESKSWGNQVNKYRKMILPYVKWFLKDQKVTGVGDRYNFGYATHMNFGVKDFIGDDPEFVQYVLDNKPELIGNAESRILFWKGALEDGVLTVDDLKKIFEDGVSMSDIIRSIPGLDDYAGRSRFGVSADRFERGTSAFGSNAFSVLCAVCDGNPFSGEETERLIAEKKISLEAFANYDIKLLTPEMQIAFVKADPGNRRTLVKLSNEIASFTVTDELWRSMVPNQSMDTEEWWGNASALLDYLDEANPPSKVDTAVDEVFSDRDIVKKLAYCITCIPRCSRSDWTEQRGYAAKLPCDVLKRLGRIFDEHDIAVPDEILAAVRGLVELIRKGTPRPNAENRWVRSVIAALDGTLGKQPGIAPLLDGTTVKGAVRIESKTGWYQEIKTLLGLLADVCGMDAVVENGFLPSNDEACLAYVATVPLSKSTADIIKGVFDRLMSSKYELHSMGSFSTESNRKYLDMVYRYPDVLDGFKWTDGDVLDFVAVLMKLLVDNQSSIGTVYESEGVARIVREVCSAVTGAAATCSEALEAWPGYGGIGTSCVQAISKYSLDAGELSGYFRRMCELMLAADVWTDIPGIYRVFVIPFDEWQAMYDKYSVVFIERYALKIPNSAFIDSEFPARFVYGCIKGMSPNEMSAVLNRLLNRDMLPKRTAVARLISEGIRSGDYAVDRDTFGLLVQYHVADAACLRVVMERQPAEGESRVSSTEDAVRVCSTLHKLMKLPSLPELILETYRFLLDKVYGNLGDGRNRWKVDENCRTEVNTLVELTRKLCNSLSKGNVAKAVAALDVPDVLDRIDGFEKANRDACDEPGNPLSKFKCESVGDMAAVRQYLEANIPEAKEIASRQADKKPARKPKAK